MKDEQGMEYGLFQWRTIKKLGVWICCDPDESSINCTLGLAVDLHGNRAICINDPELGNWPALLARGFEAKEVTECFELIEQVFNSEDETARCLLGMALRKYAGETAKRSNRNAADTLDELIGGVKILLSHDQDVRESMKKRVFQRLNSGEDLDAEVFLRS